MRERLLLERERLLLDLDRFGDERFLDFLERDRLRDLLFDRERDFERFLDDLQVQAMNVNKSKGKQSK